MSRISDEAVREIRERSDIVEVISSYLPLRRSGANYLGLCPFHQEKSPSFNVNAPRQIFHCFGCGVGGNVFTFLMRMEGLTFPEAVKRLGEKAGITVEETVVTPADRQRRDQRERLLRINEAACDFYHRLLLEDAAGSAGRRYLRQRGYEADTVKTFRLGFAPAQWEALVGHLTAQGFAAEDLRAAGLVREGRDGRGDRDLFHKRLLFPILDPEGRVVAFGGRVLDDGTPKYLNSPETPVYHKGRILYGLYQGREAIRQARAVLVVEGYFDLLALHRAGYRQCRRGLRHGLDRRPCPPAQALRRSGYPGVRCRPGRTAGDLPGHGRTASRGAVGQRRRPGCRRGSRLVPRRVRRRRRFTAAWPRLGRLWNCSSTSSCNCTATGSKAGRGPPRRSWRESAGCPATWSGISTSSSLPPGPGWTKPCCRARGAVRRPRGRHRCRPARRNASRRTRPCAPRPFCSA